MDRLKNRGRTLFFAFFEYGQLEFGNLMQNLEIRVFNFLFFIIFIFDAQVLIPRKCALHSRSRCIVHLAGQITLQ